MNENDIHELYKLKLLNETKEEITKWFKQYSIILTIVMTITSLVGTNILTANAVRSVMHDDIMKLNEAIGKFKGKRESYEELLNEIQEESRKLNKEISKHLEQLNLNKDAFKEQDSLMVSRSALNTVRIVRISEIIQQLFDDLDVDDLTNVSIKYRFKECHKRIHNLNILFNTKKKYNIEMFSIKDIAKEYITIYQTLLYNGFLVRLYENTPFEDIVNGYRLHHVKLNNNSNVIIIYENNKVDIAKEIMEYIEKLIPSAKIQLVSSPKLNNNYTNVGVFLN